MSLEANWSLSRGFEDRPRKESRENQPIECVNITAQLGCDSDLPSKERGDSVITSETSAVLYADALLRDDCPPVIIGMPHAGELVPKIVYDRTNQPEAFGGQGGLDTGTISLFAPRHDEFVGARARVNRIALDPNREPTDFKGKPPSMKGICWETDLAGNPIYPPGQELALEEKRQLIDDFYNPYFNKLHALAASLFDRRDSTGKTQNKQILFIDGHSFPGDESVPAYGLSAEEPKPLIIVGTGKGKTAIPGAEQRVVDALVEKLAALIPDEMVDAKQFSEKITVNKIWTGTKNINYWGLKENPLTGAGQQSQAIQIEVNRSFFMKDGKYDKGRLDLLHDAIYAAVQSAVEEMQKGEK